MEALWKPYGGPMEALWRQRTQDAVSPGLPPTQRKTAPTPAEGGGRDSVHAKAVPPPCVAPAQLQGCRRGFFSLQNSDFVFFEHKNIAFMLFQCKN